VNRMIKLFQQKSNRKFDEYLLCKRKSLSEYVKDLPVSQAAKDAKSVATYPSIQDVMCAVLKAESDTWAKAAELLRKEELSK
jgi:hypothetical protein